MRRLVVAPSGLGRVFAQSQYYENASPFDHHSYPLLAMSLPGKLNSISATAIPFFSRTLTFETQKMRTKSDTFQKITQHFQQTSKSTQVLHEPPICICS
jgi:hypothetical protein